jgi:plastocyanin
MPRAVFETRAVSGIVKFRTESQSPWDYGLDVAFYPSELVVLPGQTVAWLWSWSGPECPLYDVTFEDDPTEPISSSPQGEGTHFRTFDRPGEYRYRSTSHSTGFAEGMVGIVRADAVDGESNRR